MLVAELSYPTYRAPLTSTYNSLWHFGQIVFAFAYLSSLLSSHLTEVVDSAAWATFGSFKIQNTWAWRLPSALQAVPSLIQVLMVLFVPESPRFLVNKGKEAQALKILAYYHADGDEYVWLCLSLELHLT
jgi:hypothetical protein